MRVTTTLDVDRLPEDRLLAFYEQIGTAEMDGHTFEITRSMNGTGFAFYEEVDGLTVVHTLSIAPVIQSALEAIIGTTPGEPPHGSIVMLHGRTGTAYQRYFRDGLWHADGMEPQTWADLIDGVRVQVIYVAPEDPS